MKIHDCNSNFADIFYKSKKIKLINEIYLFNLIFILIKLNIFFELSKYISLSFNSLDFIFA